MKTSNSGRMFLLLLAAALLRTSSGVLQAADQFVQVINPGWTNSSQASWMGVWGDYDNDGFLDLFVSNSANSSGGGRTNFLYHNNGDGTFTPRFADQVGSIASDKDSSGGAYWADVNNDGFLDLLVMNWSNFGTVTSPLYLNRGDGTFRSAKAGDLTKQYYSNGVGALADYDNDGLLDVFLATAQSNGYTNRLFHARVDGTFSLVTNSVVATDQSVLSNDAAWGDFNNDGLPDLIVANPSGHDFFYRNDGRGQFTRLTNSILEKPGYQSAHYTWGDYDNDGFLDLAQGTVGATRLFRNTGSGDFVVVTNWAAADAGVPVWGDYDNDGYLDLLVPRDNGGGSQLRLFHNNGDGTFTRVEDVFTRSSAHWFAGTWGDYDNDGFLDLFVAEVTGRNALYHNLGNTNHWLKFQLRGVVANRSAIGAKVRVKATIGGKTFWQMRELSASGASQNDVRPNFGLGDATNVDVVRIEWPSGNVQELTDVAPNKLLTVTEQPNITPTNPSSSLNGSVTLTSTLTGTYQWRFDDADLAGETHKTLNLVGIQASQAGPYRVVVTTPDQTVTNHVYLNVDSTFTKITTGPVVTDVESSEAPSWWDYDNDGLLDLFVPNALVPPGLVTHSVYHNNGDGTFTKMTNAISTHKGLSFDGAVGDYNNDGLDDLFVTEGDGADDLYRNDGGGHFTRLTTAEAGAPVGDVDYSVDAGWADYDRDGFIDLFVANGYFLAQGGEFTAGNDKLYRNNGDGTFTKMTTNQVGMLVGDRASTGPCAWADYDNDGWPDLWVGNGYSPASNGKQYLYHNNRDGTFSQVQGGSLAENIATGMGYWADYDNDGYLELFLTAFKGTNSLHRYLGGQTFTNVAKSAGVAKAMVAWLAAWGDYDNDGYLDLFVAGYNGGSRSVLYHNNGDGTFTSVDVGSPLQEGANRSGVAWADYDNDGFLDLLITCGDGVPTRNLLYHNNGNGNHWLKLKLAGTASNRSAIGAKVHVNATIGGKTFWQMREISGNSGASGGAGGLVAHFGLGDATNVTTLRIEWPSGNVQELADVAPNQMLTIKEAVNITPTNPSSSLNGSVTLTSQLAGSYQWRFDGADLVGETNKTLKLAGIQTNQAGPYSVVVTTTAQTVTNHVSLTVDPTFTQITQGPIVKDVGNAMGHTWGDYDNDGFLDLFVANGVWNSFGSPGTPMSSFLYHNNGDGTFSRITNGPLTTLKVDANAAAFADYDNDGFLDLLVGIGGAGPNILWHNNGDGTFTRMTNGPLATDRPNNCFGATWVDYNNDGLVDVFVTAWNQGNDLLYRNNGDGTFTRMTAPDVGNIVLDQSATSAPAWADYDNDGWPDAFVVVDTVGASGSILHKNLLYHNRGNGAFERVTNDIIAQQGGTSMGGAWGDYDNDGWPDLFVPSDAGGRSYLYHNLQNGHFEEVTTGPLVHDPGRLSYMGCWGDYDNDGFLDLYVAKLGGGFLYHNNGDGTFSSVTTGSIVTDTGNCATASWVDYDNDGFLDLFVGHGSVGGGQISRLYHNNGNSNAWLVVRPVGTASNRSALGAKIRVLATYAGKTRWQLREIGSTESWKGPNLIAHFGLGNATNVWTLRIEWPSGAVQELTDVPPRQFLTIWEPPALKAAIQEDGACELTVTAEPNRTWRIDASSDLETWQPLATVSNTTATFGYTDAASAAMARRFYRVVAE
jgi:ASPIC and UnbV/FG-GAP-like repeat